LLHRKSLFALAIKNFPGCRRDFRVKMWGTSLLLDKLADDPGTAIEGARISGPRSDFFTAGKFATGNLDFCNNIGTTRTQADPRRIEFPQRSTSGCDIVPSAA
jgi:hypothetical protein